MHNNPFAPIPAQFYGIRHPLYTNCEALGISNMKKMQHQRYGSDVTFFIALRGISGSRLMEVFIEICLENSFLLHASLIRSLMFQNLNEILLYT